MDKKTEKDRVIEGDNCQITNPLYGRFKEVSACIVGGGPSNKKRQEKDRSQSTSLEDREAKKEKEPDTDSSE